MILCATSLLTTHRVSGATIYTRRILFYAQLTKKYIIKRTSKPVSKLLTASCNPLSADEILSITVPINARCSSEIDARPSRSFSSSDRAPDGVRLVRWPFSKAGRGGDLGCHMTTCRPSRIRRNPLRRHLRVARLARRYGRGRRSTLHHLRKKIPRRRALLRRAKVRATR